MDLRASIANPDASVGLFAGNPVPLWRFDFGAYGDLPIYVWDEHLENALETAADYGRERGWQTIFEEPEWDQAREELIDEGISDPSDEEVNEAATTDLTHTASGYLGPDWAFDEIPMDSSEYQQVLLASQITNLQGDPSDQQVMVNPWQSVWDEWDHGKLNHGMLPFVTAWLRPLCDYLVPVQLYPHFVVGEERLKRWAVAVACEQNQEEALTELQALNKHLNAFADIQSSLQVLMLEGTEWVSLGDNEAHYRHERDLEPQEYAARVIATLNIKINPYVSTIQIQFIFVERQYAPEFIEFDED